MNDSANDQGNPNEPEAGPANVDSAPPAVIAKDVEDFLKGEPTPTPEDARHLFKERPDCASILTTEGWMRRDGIIDPA